MSFSLPNLRTPSKNCELLAALSLPLSYSKLQHSNEWNRNFSFHFGLVPSAYSIANVVYVYNFADCFIDAICGQTFMFDFVV